MTSKSAGRTGLLSVVLAMVAGTTLGAQSVRGVVVDPAERPMSGVVVSLVDSASTIVARTLTGDNGEYRFVAPRSGTYTLRALRIGFQPVESAPLVLAASAAVVHPILMNSARVQLETVRIERKNVCGRQQTPVDGQQFALWEQAMTSMAATAMTSSTRGYTSTALNVSRTLDPDGRKIRTQDITMRTESVKQPWQAQDAAALRRTGYVRTDAKGWYVYDAPGLDVLTSPFFLEDHCLRLVAGRDSSEIGVQFEPAPSRRRNADITGTLWLSRATAQLRRMDFGYTNIPNAPQAAADVAGGTMTFAHLPGGTIVISSWELRMPVLEKMRLTARTSYVAEVHSSGGQVVVMRRGNDTLYKRPSLTVAGVVLDSTTGRPVSQAPVSLVGTTFQSITGPDGAFRIADVLPGEYDLAVRTPSLDSIRASSQTKIVAIEGMPALRIKVPTAAELALSVCGTSLSGAAGRGKGAVLGTVRMLGDTAALPNVSVVADWNEFTVSNSSAVPLRVGKRMSTKTDATGAYRLCGVPTEAALIVRALPNVGKALPTSVTLSPSVRFVSATLQVDNSKSAVAAFTGVVVADSSDRLLADADVSIPALSLTTRSDDRGVFRLTDVPVGSHEVLVRRVGYGAVTATLTFAPNEEEDRRIVLKPLNVLDSVLVEATRLDIGMRDFEEHKRVGMGHFLTRADLELRKGESLTDIMTMIPGAGVVRGRGRQGWVLGKRAVVSLGGNGIYQPDDAERMRGMVKACYAQVWVDNMLMNPSAPTEPYDLYNFSPEQIEAIEFYAGPAQTPARYANLNSNCGVMVIHTRRHETKK
jgi:hypothetical protein